FFGEIALLLSMPRTASIIAKGYCDLYSLDKETFDTILGRYPLFAENIKTLAEKRREEINSAHSKNENENKIDDREYSVPNKITQLISKINGSEIELCWKDVKDFGHYEVVRRISNSNQWIFLDKNLNTSGFVDRNPENLVKLDYRVRAVNISGPGSWSDITSVSEIKDEYSS
ncbi:MAG: cyclic nucleotide-binding domain-containing protein, partial [Spirochaetales bacterium]|nr:cyclic nucleotide-binding domain-containing protein [Spirochaetales bacterium]